MPLYLLVIGPIFIATVGYFLPRHIFKYLLLVSQVALFGLAVSLLVIVRADGELLQQVGDWPAGVGIALRADLLGSTMVLFTTLVYLFLIVYSFQKQYTDNMFQFLFLVIQGVTISVFLSQDIFNIYVLIEVMTIIISVLIMWKRGKQAIYDGTLYLLINLAAMSFFLLGVGFVYRALGALNFQIMTERVALISDTRALILPFTLLMTAIGLKSAIMPVFTWLPHAHGTPSAPSIVSAALSGLLVKVGVYMFIRVREIFEAAFVIDEFFLAIGAATAIIGFMLALTQKDMKLILAYSTVSQIGLIMVGLNSGVQESFLGGQFHILNHGVFKVLLFLGAGAIAKEYGTKDINEIRGVFRRMPVIATAITLAMLGIIGTPFFNGAISKYLIQAGFAGTPDLVVYFINFGTTLVFVKFSTILFGPRGERTQPRDPFVESSLAVMSVFVLLMGAFARPIIGYLFGIDVSVEGAFYLDKVIAYVLTVGIAIGVYYFALRKAQFLRTIREFRFEFPNVALFLCIYFAAMTGYLYIFVA